VNYLYGIRKLGIWWGYCDLSGCASLTLPLQLLGSSIANKGDVRATFLDEFRTTVPVPDRTGNAQFILYNTLLLQNHPGSFRRFCFPQKYRSWFPLTNTDYDMPPGTVDRDGPLVTDPTQAALLVKLLGREGADRVLFIFRTQALVDHACSTSADTDIPWDEWGRGTMTMEILCMTTNQTS